MNGNALVIHEPVIGNNKLIFETPNFEVPAGSYNLIFTFGGNYSGDNVWYKETEDVLINIIN